MVLGGVSGGSASSWGDASSGGSASSGGDPYDGDDFYCDVAIPHPERLSVVHDDDAVLAFHHTRPFWEVHVVVVPKRHLASLTSVGADDEADVRRLLAVVQSVARTVETEHGAAAVLTNLGRYQDSKHLHVHVHSGARLRG